MNEIQIIMIIVLIMLCILLWIMFELKYQQQINEFLKKIFKDF